MKSLISFINKQQCISASKKLNMHANEGGFETTVFGEKGEAEYCFDITISPSDCKLAAAFFESYAEENGGYFSNIIKYPHFLDKEQRALLNIF